MTIRRGAPWGDTGPVPPGAVEAVDDSAVAAVVARCRACRSAVPPVVLRGGDLMRALGGTGDTRGAHDVARLPVDVVRVEVGDEQRWFVAHLVARRWWWRGEVVMAMNAQHLGRWDVAPRAHPNDGRVDVVRVSRQMSLRDRWRARLRAVHGAHIPHPSITLSVCTETTLGFARPSWLWLDGRRWRRATSVRLIVEPDAVTVCV